MHIIQNSYNFKPVDGKYEWGRQAFYILQDGITYYGTWPDRSSKPTHLEQLENLQQMHTEDRGPELQPTWAVSTQEGCYVKQPAIGRFHKSNLTDELVAELEMCEVLRKNPKPNIATYYGCLEKNGRAAGLCFKRYATTLRSKVNPAGLDTEPFRSSGREQVDDSVRDSLRGILDGIKQLHSLGYVHNIIHPGNIMFDEDGVPVIIGFRGIHKTGEYLLRCGAGRIVGWFDRGFEIALEKNDLDAFEELKTWLIASLDDAFLFEAEDTLSKECPCPEEMLASR